METILTFIICVVVSIIVVAIVNRTYRFNSNVDSPKGLDLPEFKVVEIREAYSVIKFRQIAEYTVVNSFFKRKNARGWVYRKYKFYDEPGKYKIGDILTLNKRDDNRTKAKAYDEALERLKPLYEQAKKDDNPIWSTYEYLVPELRESEDERIRKWLIKTIHLIGVDKDICADQEIMDKAIAWLEKQKEPVVDKEGLYYYLGGKFIYCGYPAMEENPYDFAMSQQEKQKEPHYTKRNALFDKCVENCDPKVMKEVSDKVDEMLEKEQKPVQTEEEREYVKVLKSLISDFIRDNYKTTDISFYQQIYDWLDGRHIEQKSAEWSEEDEEMLDAMIDIVSNSLYEPLCPREGMLDWLKSLRPRSIQNKFDEAMHVADKFEEGYKAGVYDTKRKQWKPSEEQMKALNALNCHGDLSYVGQQNQLISLYNDLKKLM